MTKKVCITGYGVICAIGVDANACLSSLKEQKHGIALLKNLDSIHTNKLLVGQVDATTENLQKKAKLQHINTNSRGAILGIIAVKEAIQHAKLSPKELENTALITGTSVGGMDLFEQGYPGVINQKIKNPKYYFEEHDCGNINSKIATEIGLKGYMSTISTACSSSANAILLGTRMIKAGLVDRAIVGGSDALSKFTINGFNTLGILDENHTSPFDKDRKGLNLGEGAAYLILEAEENCANKKVYGAVAGYGNANDSFHQTASSEEGKGSKISINKALEMANILPDKIDHINTHGTGTPNNDLSESRAMTAIFGKDSVPKFSSLKPFTGHTLAACGSIEAVFSLFAIQEQVLFPSLNFKSKIEETALTPILQSENQEISTVLSNSFGFGGNCTSLIFTKN